MRWLVVLVGACGTASPPPPPPLVGSAAANAVLSAPPSPACAWRGPWEYGQPDALALREGGPPFATLGRADRATLELGPNGAFVDISTAVLSVRGFVDRRAVRLHPARALAIEAYVLPGPRAVLHPREAGSGKVVVAPVLPRYLVADAPPRARLTCDELSLEVATFDPNTVLGDVRAADGALAASSMPLRARADGPRVAELQLADDVPVSVLEHQGGLARVVLDPYADAEADTHVVGWVPSQHLRPGWGGRSISGGFGGGRGAPRGRPAKRSVRCSHEVAFAVVLGGERRVVGAIAAGAEIGLVDETSERIPVAIGRLGLALADGARAEIERSAVADCN